MPGLEEDAIALTLEKGALSISGERKVSEEGVRFFCRKSGHYNYRVILPDTVDQENPKAAYRHGMMTIRFPKSGESKTRVIEFSS